MPSNAEAAALLNAIADLLDVRGEKFKPEAYRRAARSIEGLGEELTALAARGEIDEIPGVGPAISEKLREYLRDGRIPYLDRISTEVPPGILALLKVPGLGPKTVRRFWTELAIDGPPALARAIDEGRLNGVRGFGPTKIHQIRTALDARPSAGRIPLLEATRLAATLVEGIRRAVPVDRIEVAGSLRRARETVGDLDLLVIAADAEAVFDAVPKLPRVASVVLRGGTKETVLLDSGLQVDVRVLAPASFGAAWQYFTGSKDHNVTLRSRARDMGLKINEYGVYRGDEVVAGANEEEVYRSLGLAWIPPELRENRGEIDRAATGPLTPIVEAKDLTGDLHVHLAAEDLGAQLPTLRASASAAGLSYVGVVLDRPLDPSERARAGTGAGGVVVHWGLEVPPEAVGRPRPSGVDFLLLRGGESPPPSAGPRAGELLAATHLPFAPPGRAEGDPARAGPWVRWAAEHGVALEIGPTGAADGLDSSTARTFVGRSGRVLLSSGGTGTVDRTGLAVALAIARRAGLEPTDVITTRAWPSAGATDPPTTPRRRTPSPPGAVPGDRPRS